MPVLGILALPAQLWQSALFSNSRPFLVFPRFSGLGIDMAWWPVIEPSSFDVVLGIGFTKFYHFCQISPAWC